MTRPASKNATCPTMSRHLSYYYFVCFFLSLTASVSAFSPAVSLPQPRAAGSSQIGRPSSSVTRLHVLSDNKWQLPGFSEKAGESKKKTKRDASYSGTTEYERKKTSKNRNNNNGYNNNNNNNNFLSSFFPQDTAEESSGSSPMGDLTKFLNPKGSKEVGTTQDSNNNDELWPLLGVAAVATLALGAGLSGNIPTSEISSFFEGFVQDPTATLERVTESVANMGPLGPVYFGLVYIICEVLAVPAIPLTASAGYLFGISTGTLVVLLSASVASTISFTIGRTLLRDTVENAMADNPKFAKLDKAIGREGFKLMLLLRLSPIFPFALSNYLYGATSIDFASFFAGTLLGFAPGTMAYVYSGVVGKALTLGGDGAQPWYVYAGGAVVFGGLLKLLVDVAGNIIEEMEEAAENEQ